MKTNVHIYKVWTAGLALAALAMAVTTACNDTQYAPEQTEEENHRVPVTLMVMQPGGGDEDGKPDTRLGYTDNLGEDGLGTVKVKWEDGDQLKVFTFKADGSFNQADKNGEILTTNGVTDANGMVKFTGTITPGHDGKIYCAYGSLITNDKWRPSRDAFSINNNNFTQDCKYPMKHLADSDILYAVGEEGKPLSFKRAVAMLRFLVTLPEAKSIRQLSLNKSADGSKPFVSVIKLKLTANDGWGEDFDAGSYIYLHLQNHAASTEVIGYLLIGSRPNVPGQDITLKLAATDGTTYQSKFHLNDLPNGWEPGKCYTIKTDVQKVNP